MIKEIDMQSWFEQALPNSIKWEGAEGRTLCPWHDDKNPSLFVNRFTGKFYCHGCNVGGGLRKFSQMTKTNLPNAGKVRFIPNQNSKGTVRRSILKTKTHEREHIYLDEHGMGIHLIGVDGTGGEKKVTQYRIGGPGIWFTGSPKQRVPYNLPSIMKAIHEDETIFVVEGEKDVDTLTKHGVVATTNPNGALKWPDDEEFNKHFYDADVVIIPDNDQVGLDHAKHVGAILQSIAATVRVLALPGVSEKGDVTDWVNLGGDPKALRQMADLSGILVQEPQPNKTSNIDPSMVAPASKCTTMGQSKSPDEYFDGRGGFRPVALGKHVLRDLPMKYFRGSFYVYEDGYYHADAERKVQQYCQEALGDRSRSRHIHEVMEWLKNKAYVPDSTVAVPDDGFVNVKNGRLNWQTGELLPHTPERFCTVQIPVTYDPKALAEDVQEFVEAVVPPDVVPAIWQLFGYCLIPSAKYTAAFLLTGAGSNGKSTFISLLGAFVGEENVASATLRELESTRFSSSQLRDKLINSVADLEYTALEKSDVFKKITAGDMITAEYKGKDPFRFSPFSKCVLAANEPPASRDQTLAFFRRWRVFLFPYTFGDFPGAKKADPDKIKQLKSPENLSGLLNLAIKGLCTLFAKGAFEETPSMIKAKQNYRASVDSVKGFFDECITVFLSHSETTRKLYSEYETWCEENGVKAYKKPRFFKHLEEHLPDPGRKRQHAGPEYYAGIVLKPQSQWGMAPNTQ